MDENKIIYINKLNKTGELDHFTIFNFFLLFFKR